MMTMTTIPWILSGLVFIQPGPNVPTNPSLSFADDPALKALVEEALHNRPELTQAQALLDAEAQRAQRADAWPDPVLSLGIQNDSFTRLQIGQMEGSYLSIGAAQTLPWFGKRALRAEAAKAGVRRVGAIQERIRLTTIAEVSRAYLDLLLARDQLGLLGKLEGLWQQTAALTRTRYEAGQGTQSDFLRAQLEQNRLRQRRWALEAEEKTRRAALNRLRGRAPDESAATSTTLLSLIDPKEKTPQDAWAEAEQQSPELEATRSDTARTGFELALARKDYFPDVTLSAGIMPRWGKFEPMWQLGVSVNLPVWTAHKQKPAVAEGEARTRAASASQESIRQILRERVSERLSLLHSLRQSNQLYRAGLLVQSEATVKSTLGQYQVGSLGLLPVLEAISGYLNDVNGFLQSVAAVQKVEIALSEASLEATATAGMGALLSGSGLSGLGAGMGPAAGGMEGGSGSAPLAPQAGGASTGMKGM